ncbi:MAG: MBL fold metallo-hydrolase [Candidatus Handelsmanbacteria bacterium]|nr:MBL fold metallo-hydrolase [Candidatus Handelsmanbacteria bacterium]
MRPARRWQPLGEDLFLYPDTCNVYLLRYGDCGLAIDFGSGRWLEHLGEIGVRQVEHVALTHAHRDQCAGLYRGVGGPWTVHVPQGELALLQGLDSFWRNCQSAGCPSSYAAPCLPLGRVQADLAGDAERRLGPALLCGVATPGHNQGALSYLVEWRGRHLAFCGDAAHTGGKIHQPYHLEWDHWTPGGALAAWQGLERLGNCHFDWLLPSHGPPILRQARACVRQVQRRLMDLIRAKGSVCAGEPNRWHEVEPLACGASRVLPHLYQFGANSFLLVSRAGAGLVVDPTLADVEQLEPLRTEIGLERVEVTTASHYHLDHSDGLNWVRRQYGAKVWLQPWVEAPLRRRDQWDLPWLPATDVVTDRRWPEQGRWRWREYPFEIYPFPGQTWWHCAFATQVDGRRVLFSGDNFQPPSRWNGTGGFCSFNGSRFREGFARSARLILDLAPELICNGHGCVYRFAPSHYRRILKWSGQAERAVHALCPSADWLADYDCRAFTWEPFVSRAAPGQRLRLHLVHRNHRRRAVELKGRAVGPPDWKTSPAQRQVRVKAGASGRLRFEVQVPAEAAPGRHLVAAEVESGGRLLGEVCAAIVDIA